MAFARKLKLGRIVVSAEGGVAPNARPPPVCRGASGPSGGRSLFDVEQQLVEAVLLDAEGEPTSVKRIWFPA